MPIQPTHRHSLVQKYRGSAIWSRSADPQGNPQPVRCESQWMDVPASNPQADSLRSILNASSSLSRIKPLWPTATPSILHPYSAVTLLTPSHLFPVIISQINCLYPSPCLRLYFHRNSKKSIIMNLMWNAQLEKDVQGPKWSKTWQPQRTYVRKYHITYFPPLTK